MLNKSINILKKKITYWLQAFKWFYKSKILDKHINALVIQPYDLSPLGLPAPWTRAAAVVPPETAGATACRRRTTPSAHPSESPSPPEPSQSTEQDSPAPQPAGSPAPCAKDAPHSLCAAAAWPSSPLGYPLRPIPTSSPSDCGERHY